MPRGQGAGKEFELIMEFVEDGRRVKEFEVEQFPATETQPPYLSAWVESEIGKEFRIVLKCYQPKLRVGKREVMATVYIDGRREERVVDRLMFLSNSKQHVVESVNFEKGRKTYTYPLVFSAPDTVEDRFKAEVMAADAHAAGSIIVELDYGSSHGDRGRAFPAPVMKEVGTIWEQDAKMGTIVKSTGKAKKAAAAREAQMHRDASVFTPDPDLDNYFYEFRINYATRPVIDRYLDKKYGRGEFAAPPTPVSKAVTPQSRASVSQQPQAGPSSSKPPPKRPRAASVISSLSSSSSSSASSTASAIAPPVGEAGLMEMFKMFMSQQEEARKQKRKAKEAKKLKKAEKKQKKAERKRQKRESRRSDFVDLTIDSDIEVEPAEAGGSGTVDVRGEASSGVKTEPGA